MSEMDFPLPLDQNVFKIIKYEKVPKLLNPLMCIITMIAQPPLEKYHTQEEVQWFIKFLISKENPLKVTTAEQNVEKRYYLSLKARF